MNYDEFLEFMKLKNVIANYRNYSDYELQAYFLKIFDNSLLVEQVMLTKKQDLIAYFFDPCILKDKNRVQKKTFHASLLQLFISNKDWENFNFFYPVMNFFKDKKLAQRKFNHHCFNSYLLCPRGNYPLDDLFFNPLLPIHIQIYPKSSDTLNFLYHVFCNDLPLFEKVIHQNRGLDIEPIYHKMMSFIIDSGDIDKMVAIIERLDFKDTLPERICKIKKLFFEQNEIDISKPTPDDFYEDGELLKILGVLEEKHQIYHQIPSELMQSHTQRYKI